jgi:nucleosome binding factor SPN SPT16 subunit
MHTFLNILTIVVPVLYLMSTRQRKIIANLVLGWLMSAMNTVLIFFLGVWMTLQVLDTDFISGMLEDEETEDIYEEPDPSDESEDEDAEDNDKPSPEKDEDIPDEEDESDEEDEYDEEESRPQPTKAYT